MNATLVSICFSNTMVLKRVIGKWIFIIYNFFEIAFGMSTFYYDSKLKIFKINKTLKIISHAIKCSTIFLYPISCKRSLIFFDANSNGTTEYARYLTFALNWLVLVLVYSNEAIHSGESFQLSNQMLKIFNQHRNSASYALVTRSVSKSLFVFSGLLYVNYHKYSFNMRKNLNFSETLLTIYLFAPYVIMVLSSAKIVNTMSYMDHFLHIIRNKFTSKLSAEVQNASVAYSNLHNLFTRFNKVNALNFAVVVNFCFVNSVYEVRIYLTFYFF